MGELPSYDAIMAGNKSGSEGSSEERKEPAEPFDVPTPHAPPPPPAPPAAPPATGPQFRRSAERETRIYRKVLLPSACAMLGALFALQIFLCVAAWFSPSSTVGLLIGLLCFGPLTLAVTFSCYTFTGGCRCFDSSWHVSMSLLMLVTMMLMLPATAVMCTFLPMLHGLSKDSSPAIYSGPVLPFGTPAMHGTLVNYYNFDQPLSIDSTLLGSTTARFRTKNGYRFETFSATPILSLDARTNRGDRETHMWACACKREYGCRKFPAVDVSGFASRKEPWKYQWNPDRLTTGVRVRSAALLKFCRVAARSSIANIQAQGLNLTLTDPANGGAFVEMADFASLTRRLKLIIFLTGGLLDLAALVIFLLLLRVALNSGQ